MGNISLTFINARYFHKFALSRLEVLTHFVGKECRSIRITRVELIQTDEQLFKGKTTGSLMQCHPAKIGIENARLVRIAQIHDQAVAWGTDKLGPGNDERKWQCRSE